MKLVKIGAVVAVSIFALSACTALSDYLDDWTGMTKEERCADREARLAALYAAAEYRELTQSERRLIMDYELYVHLSCAVGLVAE